MSLYFLFSFLLVKPSVSESDGCVDKHESCSFWAGLDECAKNPNYMLSNCPVSCNTCENNGGIASCSDTHESCSFWASIDECEKNPRYMLKNCPESCNSCSFDEDTFGEIQVEEICADGDHFCEAAKVQTTIPRFANADGSARVASNDCNDRYMECADYATDGECSNNPGWMIVNCPLSCKLCELRDPKVRCSRDKLNMSTSPVYQPGDMNSMFQSLVEDYHDKHHVEILSTDPWVVTFENFLSDKEASALIAKQDNWERSTDTGSSNEYGETGRILSSGRTSSNSWCREECEADPHVQNVIQRIEGVTRIGRENFESFQVLKYDVGQKYVTHHDSSEEDVDMVCGPRILTLFLYLSDVEDGGETNFPLLGLSVKPKKGRAVLWPSTLNHNPEAIDGRTVHQSLPVIKGRKFGANAWIHLYNFEEANKWGCTGVFDDK